MKTNKEEFKKLIQFYEAITFEELNELKDKDGEITFTDYCTAFGSRNLCTLCHKVGYRDNSYMPQCRDCVYSVLGGDATESATEWCGWGPLGYNMKVLTDYYKPKVIYEALQERIVLMKCVLRKVEELEEGEDEKSISERK